MSKFVIAGDAVIEKVVGEYGVIYGLKKYRGRKVKIVILAEDQDKEAEG